MKATNIIVGGIGGMAVDIFVQNGVEVHAGITSGKPSELVEKFINGELTNSPEACEHHDHDHEHEHDHEHHHNQN
jgi:predicted Fe-Mo cluster-binding NifX family protein